MLNRFFNMAAYNQNGREGPEVAGRQESYLFWIAWVAHQSAQLFSTADAHGPFRPSLISGSCQFFRGLVRGPAGDRVPHEPDAPAGQPDPLRRMIKQAPTFGRIFAMVAFALSCFGILLFLWLEFGGPVPLKAEGYRVKVAFPEAVGLAEDVDVRSAGISIGTVRKVEVEESTHSALATSCSSRATRRFPAMPGRS